MTLESFVSVVAPIYNPEEFLESFVQSVASPVQAVPSGLKFDSQSPAPSHASWLLHSFSIGSPP